MTDGDMRRTPGAKILGIRTPSRSTAGVGRARTWAVITTVALGVALFVVILVVTPWQTLPADVPGGQVPVDPSRDFTAEQIALENAYHNAIRPPAYTSLLVTVALALVLGFTKLGARLVTLVARPLGGGWFWQILLGAVAIIVLGRLITLPFAIRTEVVRRDYGLSTQDWGSWTIDEAKGLGVNLVLILVLLLGLFGLSHRLPRWWWASAAGLGALLVVVVSYVYPVVVQPIFNKFTSMAEGTLKSSLLELARSDGLPVDDVLVADASRRTTQLNAYVSGYGSTRRIVVYDTTLREMSEDEIRLIAAHELGHVKHNDVLHYTLVGALGVATGACVLYLAITSRWAQRRAGVPGPSDGGVTLPLDPRAVALVLAVMTVLSTVSGPVVNLISRRIEARADVHSLELTRDPAALIAMQQRLAVTNLSELNPNPIVYGLFATHPSSPERIALARNWAKINGLPEP